MSFEKKAYNKRSMQKKSTSPVKAKHGNLKPLMTEEQKSSANIQELSYDFACRIIRLYQYLTEPISEDRYEISDNHLSRITNHSSAHEREYVMSKQVYRSGTSIGANVREAQHAQSDADFLSKMSIAYKEADETSYWINLLHDNGYIVNEAFDSLINDNNRLLRLLTSIVKSIKSKIETSKQK